MSQKELVNNNNNVTKNENNQTNQNNDQKTIKWFINTVINQMEHI